MKVRYTMLAILAFSLFSISSYAQPFNGYGVLDGIDDYFAAENIFKDKDFTIEMFFRSCLVDYGPYKLLVSNDENFSAGFAKKVCNGCGLDTTKISYKECLTDGGSCGGCGSEYPDQCTDCSEWFYFVLQYNKAEQQLWSYWNGLGGPGLYVSCGELTANTPIVLGKKLTVGDPMEYLSGYIDEVRVSDNMRYDVGLIDIPTQPFTADANTVALWHFDLTDSATTSIPDASGNNNTLYLYGGAYLSYDVSATIDGPTSVFTNTNYLFSVDVLPPGMITEWSASGGTITPQNEKETLISWSTSGDYYINVSGSNSASGCESFIDSLLVKVSEGTAIPIITSTVLESTIDIFPNPASKDCTIKFTLPTSSSVQLSLSSIYSKDSYVLKDQMYGAGTYEITFGDELSLSSGVYLIGLQTSTELVMRKLVFIDQD